MFGFLAKFIGCVLIASSANFSIAQENAPVSVESAQAEFPATAHATVAYISDGLIGMLGHARERFNEDPQGFYSDIDSVIAPWLDFDAWTSGVMDEYFEQASEEQVQAFTDVFHQSLVETYAKGLLNVKDATYEIAPPRERDEDKNLVGVSQKIHSGSEHIQVQYTMVKGSDGRWQIKNARLDGISLGPVFRSQFKGAAEDNGGDIDLVIQNWGL